jgi:hypothetical protein
VVLYAATARSLVAMNPVYVDLVDGPTAWADADLGHFRLADQPRAVGLHQLSVLLQDRLDLETDLDLVADHDAATVEWHVELDPEVGPADLGPR